MGMGHGANYVDVVEEDTVKKLCKKEHEIFIDLVDDDLDQFARDAEFNDIKGYKKEVVKAYEKLCEAFEKKTGLSLSLGFHDADDNGDIYDDVNGLYWAVGGVWQLTPAGKKMGKKVERKLFVTFG